MTQPMDLVRFGAAKASDRKELALIAYDTAYQNPDEANWQAIADMLRACLPERKTKVAGAPTWWHDYAVKSNAALRKAEREIVECQFADGRVVRSYALSLSGKGFNIGRALRLAIAFYRVKFHAKAVPGFMGVRAAGQLQNYPVADLDRLTFEWRLPSYGADPVPFGCDEGRIPAVETELERRREARRLNAWFAERLDASEEKNRAIAANLDSQFAAAIAAGERELEKLRNRLGA